MERKEQAPPRGDRRRVRAWNPEQFSNRLKAGFPDDEGMRISHEAIYQGLYVEGRGALKREPAACLRSGRALRVPRARTRQKAWAHVTPEVMIHQRPPEAPRGRRPGRGRALGGRPGHRAAPLRDRHPRRTHHEAHDPDPFAPRRGLRHHRPHQKRPGPRRLRRQHHERRASSIDVPAARTPAPLTGLGQGQSPRRAHRRHRHTRLLRRPQNPLATRHQREHQRPLAPLLPQRNRPLPMDRRRHRGRRPRLEHPAPKNTRTENPGRNPQRAPTLPATTRCCDDRLNPACDPLSEWKITPLMSPPLVATAVLTAALASSAAG